MDELDIVAAAAGDPRAGIQRIYFGVVIALAFVMAANYKRLSVVLGILGIIVLTSTVVYAPESMFRALGGAGASFLEWAGNAL